MNKPKYHLGQSVYLRTDPDQYERVVTGIIYREIGIIYIVGFIGTETYHYHFELNSKPDVLKRIDAPGSVN